ncbi:Dihydro-orotase-like [Reichenbachiella faecimaris]|uniref:Dihydro-orotase-like n=1 Tax=Reichenbachiella faecimaris TaxID=692418 RepID=A0A1W2GK76_REIFA|nr:hypothetical protein [Reichenbachiella faecimaris]SMD36954.1 Dihydro-orotase-like [Reichenbachiella faecimaris]
MTRRKSASFPFVLVFILFPVMVQAQVWQSYEWAYYHLQFELPQEFAVTTNTEEALEASKEGIEFGLYPLKDSALEGLDLAGFVIKMAEDDLNLSEIDEMELLEFESMSGGFVSGTKDGRIYLVLGLMDKENKNNYYAYVAFEKEMEMEVAEDAMEILLSFDLLD